MEGGDEADEAEAHDQHHRRRNLQSRGVVRVEPQHVAAGAGATSATGGAVSASEPPAAHAGCGGGRAAGSHDSPWPRARGSRGLRLRSTSGHVASGGSESEECWEMVSEKKK